MCIAQESEREQAGGQMRGGRGVGRGAQAMHALRIWLLYLKCSDVPIDQTTALRKRVTDATTVIPAVTTY